MPDLNYRFIWLTRNIVRDATVLKGKQNILDLLTPPTGIYN